MRIRPGFVRRLVGSAALPVAFLLLSLGQAGADQEAPPRSFPKTAVARFELRSSGASTASFVPSPHGAARGAQSALFVVNYDGAFLANPAARAAFQYAVDLWSSQITSPVPIVVDATWRPLPPGVLGQAGATSAFRDFPNAPRNATWYPSALANRLAGVDLDPAESDVQAQFSSSIDWYLGTDGRTPRSQSDFVSVVLHELGHGLGFAGSARVLAGLGYYGGGTSYPFAYDRYVVNGAGVSPLAFLSGSHPLALQLTSDDLHFGGPAAVSANGGLRPRLYAPPDWEPGSSYSHLDEATYPIGDPNSLMTPMLARGEAIHDPGPIARGVLADLGWSTVAPVLATATPTGTPTATPTAVAATPSPTPRLTGTPVPTATPTGRPCPADPAPARSACPAPAPSPTRRAPARVLLPSVASGRPAAPGNGCDPGFCVP